MDDHYHSTLNPSADPRIYVRVLRFIRNEIADGMLQSGMPVPTIEVLTQRFGCARQTASKALRLLEDEGELVRYPGIGYYIA